MPGYFRGSADDNDNINGISILKTFSIRTSKNDETITSDQTSCDIGDDLEIPFIIKSISSAEQKKSPEQLWRLRNEYTILSEHFSLKKRQRNSRVRSALKIEEFEGVWSIFLERVEGITLEEWIVRNHETTSPSVIPCSSSKYQSLLLIRLQIARDVAAALAEVHKAKIVHNDISTESFIVNVSGGEEMKSQSKNDDKTDSSDFIEYRESHVDDNNVLVKIIDFGYALPLLECEINDYGQRVNDDLPRLATVFNRLFLNTPSDKEMTTSFLNDTSTTKLIKEINNSSKEDDNESTKKDNEDIYFIPKSIKNFLSDLNCTANLCQHKEDLPPYESVEEIKEDLGQMLEDPETFLYDDENNDFVAGKLHFSLGKIYGRSAEASKLLDVFKRVSSPSCSSCSETVLIHGKSGTGKSTLANGLRQSVTDKDGYFLYGKYDQIHCLQPYSAIIMALGEFCDMVISRGDDVVQSVSKKIKEAVTPNAKLLTDIIPKLKLIIGEEQDVFLEELNNGTQAQNRFNFVFRNFIHAISSNSRCPIVLFLDDLQWADAASIDIIKLLMSKSEKNNMSILFMGAYRDDEVVESAPTTTVGKKLFTSLLSDFEDENIKSANATRITKIQLVELDAENVNFIISDSLRMMRRLTRPLAKIIHQKTHGNPFFAVQFLKSLFDDGLLRLSSKPNSTLRRWVWDEEEINDRSVSDNVVGLMMGKIQKLSSTTRNILRVSSAIGCRFDLSTLQPIIKEQLQEEEASKSNNDIEQSVLSELNLLVKLGFIVKSGKGYHFSHDRFQQAAYSLTPKEEQDRLHLFIGRTIYNNQKKKNNKLSLSDETTQREQKEIIDVDGVDGIDEEEMFFILDQLNLGMKYISSQRERIELARLNLRVGEKAIKACAFNTATFYLKAGIEFLPDENGRRWDEHYDLSLRLYTLKADAHLVEGDFDKTHHVAELIFQHGRGLLEKIPAYICSLRSYFIQGKLNDAIITGFDVLSQLGLKFPKSPSKKHILFDIVKTKLVLRGKTDDMLSRLPLATDEKIVSSMKILNIMSLICYIGRAAYFPLIAMCMVRLSLRFGLCEESGGAFSQYGLMLAGPLGNIKEGYRFGKFSLACTERFKNAKVFSPRVRLICKALIFTWIEDAQKIADEMPHISRSALEVGENEFGMTSLSVYSSYSLQIGRPLVELERKMKSFAHQMMESKQEISFRGFKPYWQVVLNLLGRSRDTNNPCILTGDAMDEEKALYEAISSSNNLAIGKIKFCRLLVAFLFGNHALAAELGNQTRNLSKIMPGFLEVLSQAFYDSLTSLALAREEVTVSGKKKWMNIANISIRKMKKWDRHSPGNLSHRLLLLKAEKKSLQKRKAKSQKIKEQYDAAIEAAHKRGFINDEAIGCERAGICFKEIGDNLLASYYLDCARKLFCEWGADAKVCQLTSKHGELFSEQN